MKSIGKKMVAFSVAALMQLGMGAAVIEAAAPGNHYPPGFEQYAGRDKGRHDHERVQSERQKRERIENERHEREMKRRPHETRKQWKERQKREKERHERALREIRHSPPFDHHHR